MSAGRWTRRAVVAVAAYAVLLPVAVWAELGPDPLRLALVVAVALSMGWLLFDGVPDSAPNWRVEVVRTVHPPGHDTRTTLFLRLIESHLTARQPDSALRDRLGEAAERALRLRHGLSRADPGADELLGPALLGLLDGPPRRLKTAEIDAAMTRIEDL